MASYQVISQIKSVQVLGPTRVIDVEQVGVVTSPSGIYFEYPVPFDTFLDHEGRAVIGPLVDAIEEVMAGSAAIGASYFQDVDAAGLLVDYLDVVVEFIPGGARPPMTTTIPISLASFSATGDPFLVGLATSPQSLIAEAYAALEATAG